MFDLGVPADDRASATEAINLEAINLEAINLEAINLTVDR
jgi:hypothetical protein